MRGWRPSRCGVRTFPAGSGPGTGKSAEPEKRSQRACFPWLQLSARVAVRDAEYEEPDRQSDKKCVLHKSDPASVGNSSLFTISPLKTASKPIDHASRRCQSASTVSFPPARVGALGNLLGSNVRFLLTIGVARLREHR